jgi:predicted PhzF superfamily epimerase YddE/YHI9
VQVYTVATFTTKPFKGNPAGVCVFKDALPETSMLQAIASELNQPQTAFVAPSADERWHIRWFSPLVEVALCGHATLAAAHVLLKERERSPPSLAFKYAAGILDATLRDKRVWIDLPAAPGISTPSPDDLRGAVDAEPLNTSRHSDRWVFEYETADQVRDLNVNYEKLLETGVRSLIVTAPSDMKGFDIVSRNFAPIVGVNEDQATGAAHCCLGPYWRDRLGSNLTCWQASRRTGVLYISTERDRVRIGGDAVTTFTGHANFL